ncbi:EpsG family protein [Morganella morganii]|uniref:EpsG family protein n=1 Tax=Morganella morganii TaxID=582 RepID=UPI003EBDA266
MLFSLVIYNVILFGSGLFTFLQEKVRNRNIKFIFILLSFLLIFIPSAIRYNIGTDYRVYVEIFESLKQHELLYLDPGFRYINEIIIYFKLPAEILFFITSFLIYFFIFLSLPSKGKYVYLIIFITSTYFVSYNLVRSSIALSICAYSVILYYKKNNIFAYILLILLASTMHLSALLFISIPIVSFILRPYAYIHYRYLIFISLLIIFIFKNAILLFILKNIIPIIGYDQYLSLELYMSAPKINSGLGILLRAMPLLALLVFSKEILIRDPKSIIYINISLICLVCIFFSSSIEIFSRLEKIFLPAYMFSIYLIYINCNIPFHKTLTLFFVLSQILIFELTIIKSESNKCDGPRITPYVSIFNKQDDRSVQMTRMECLESKNEKNH